MRVAHLLTSAILLVILSNPVFAQQEPITLTLPQSPYIVNPNPALVDVNRLYITVKLRGAYNDSNSALTTQIEQQAKAAFKNCDINIIDTVLDENSQLGTFAQKRFGSVSNLRWRFANVPEFRIEVDLLNLPDTDQCVFRLQTSFLKKALLDGGPKANMMADVWKDEPVMGLVASKDFTESIIADVNWQTRAFIGSWSAARAADKQSDVNQTRPQSRKPAVEQRKKQTKQQAVELNYVASKNEQVFHRADCQSAGQILPKNLVSYSSREEAIAAGKRPCKYCKP
jgi:hypothetical protein